MPVEGITPDRLFDLHKHFSLVVKDQLEFCHKYLNFYTGLLSAILAATAAGLLQDTHGDPRFLLLTLGPLAIPALSWLGYKNLTVFYRRSVEAWVTVVNIEHMLGFDSDKLHEGLPPPPFPDREYHGFVARFERRPIQAAMTASSDAQCLIARVVPLGDTRKYALYTFFVFSIIAFAFGVAAVLKALV